MVTVINLVLNMPWCIKLSIEYCIKYVLNDVLNGIKYTVTVFNVRMAAREPPTWRALSTGATNIAQLGKRAK